MTQDDIAELRGHGFSDDLEQDFRRALAIGRPLGELRL